MIEFKLTVNIDGVERGIHALADNLEDVTRPLLRTGGKIRSESRALFESEGDGQWAALAESTKERKLTSPQVSLLVNHGHGKTGERSIVQRVVRDAAGMEKWSNRVDALNDAIDKARRTGRKTKGIETRRGRAIEQSEKRARKILGYRDIATDAGIGPNELVAFARHEVARSKQHGRIQRAFKQLKAKGYSFTDAERRAMLRQSKRRYNASEASTRMLGGLESTIGMKVDGMHLAVYSKSYIGAIHNDGGVAGNGAKIPQREFLKLTDADLDFFVDVLREEAIDAWIEA